LITPIHVCVRHKQTDASSSLGDVLAQDFGKIEKKKEEVT
jgi:hypothetical protein